MTPFPQNDDENLVNFLRQYRPIVPDAASDLEEKIIAAVEAAANNQPEATSRKQKQQSVFFVPNSRLFSGKSWRMPAAIAASLVMTVIGYQSLLFYQSITAKPQPNPAEMAQLEAFLESNWKAVVGESSETEWLNVIDEE